jgi:fused signal recognition particle receptor
MPWAAPIGTGQGPLNPYALKLLRDRLKVPLLVDAGLGLPSHACSVMEWGFDGVLLNTAAVAHDAIHAAISRKCDILIIDTAGRLATQEHLMEELKKVKRVIGKALPGAPHQTLLVLDGNTGQNGLSQVKAFHGALGLSALIVTKLDGTAKGGVICALAHTLKEGPIPAVLALGKGEGIDDLAPFTAAQYSSELFN